MYSYFFLKNALHYKYIYELQLLNGEIDHKDGDLIIFVTLFRMKLFHWGFNNDWSSLILCPLLDRDLVFQQHFSNELHQPGY